MISKDTIEKIFNAVEIEEVIGDFVTLKKRGVNHIGLCPFHDEKTPSFTVSPSKEIYKCFGCGKAGNAVRFLMEHEKYTYPEALKYLAKKYSIEIEEKEETDEEKQLKDEVASIYIVLNYAKEYYHNYLFNSEEGKNIGLAYFKDRNYEHETIRQFELGFSPSGKNTFTKEALKNGYKEEYLVTAGLTIKTENGELYDRFKERVIFPIQSVIGRTLGFGARTLKSNTKEAKYINSPETKVYNKRKILFGLTLAKDTIRKSDSCYLVEGYTDLLSLYQLGITNVVASLGTSLTEDHTRLIKRYTKNFTFIFDGDEAGIKASLRGIDIALKQGLNIKAIALPDGEDPDSFVKAHDIQEVKSFFEKNEEDFILFKSKLLIKGKEKDPIQRAEVVKDIVRSIALIPNHVNRSVYISELRRQLDIEEEILYSELNKQLITNRKKLVKDERYQVIEEELPKTEIEHRILATTSVEQEKKIIKLLLLHGNKEYDDDVLVADQIISEIEEAEWDDSLLLEMFNSYRQYITENETPPDIQIFINHSRKDFQDLAVEFAVDEHNISDIWTTKFGKSPINKDNYKEEIRTTLLHFELRKTQKNLKRNLKDMKETELSEEEIMQLQVAHYHLSSRMSELSKKLGIVIY